MRAIFEEQMEALLLYKYRMKYGGSAPQDFIPKALFSKFPHLQQGYNTADINLGNVLQQGLQNSDKGAIETIINQLKGLIIHSFVISQQNNWIFITQVEAYFHDKNVDDVAQVDDRDFYPETLSIDMVKCQEGRGTWYELRFRLFKIEIIATGGFFNKGGKQENRMGAFLGVAAPSELAQDSHFVLFSPIKAVKTSAQTSI